MELIVANLSGPVREATLCGRPGLVAPATLLVPGVLNGSKGPLYYSGELNTRRYMDWNGMPLVVRHPKDVDDEDVMVSAMSPEAWDRYWTGQLFGSEVDEAGVLKGEAWFDREATERHDEALSDEYKMVPRLLAGESIELSTGLHTVDVPAPEGAVYNDTPYKHVVTDYKPDHLAILPDEVGACSVKKGCGVNVVNEWSDEARKAAAEAELARLT